MAGETRICVACGGLIMRVKQSSVQWQTTKYCSRACVRLHAIQRVIAGEWRLHSKGYRMLFLPMHPAASKGEVYEHRLVMERHLGRLLKPHEVVHHKNEDKLDNRLENLELVSGSTHRILHSSQITNAEIAGMIRRGLTSRQIAAMGVGQHRIVKARREAELGLLQPLAEAR